MIGTCGRSPSCRQFAILPKVYKVSRFTVVVAYDRLVAIAVTTIRKVLASSVSKSRTPGYP